MQFDYLLSSYVLFNVFIDLTLANEVWLLYQVMRLWSLNSYKCMEEYSLPDAASLIDFDFDESKVNLKV